MTKLVALFSLFLASWGFASTGIAFDSAPFSELLEKAQKQNKLIFIDAYAEWCGPCKLMEKNVFPHKDVAAYYNTTFVNAHIDMEKGEGPALAQTYGINTYPHYLFLNGKGEVVLRGYGYLKPESFIALGQKAVLAAQAMEGSVVEKQLGFETPALQNEEKSLELSWPGKLLVTAKKALSSLWVALEPKQTLQTPLA